jgi:hypothetical protein
MSVHFVSPRSSIRTLVGDPRERSPAAASQATSRSRGDHVGDGRYGGVLARGIGLERRADYSVFYGQ